MKEWECSTCQRTFETKGGCEWHIENTHTKSGKGGEARKIDLSPDYSDAAYQLGPHVYG